MFNGAGITNKLLLEFSIYKNKLTPIMEAIIKDDSKKVETLIDNKTIEDVDISGNTPIFVAACYGKLKILKLLIRKGANIYHLNNNNENIYDVASDKIICNIKKYIKKNYPEIIDCKKYNI
jgi:ankyrin repeat protein